MRLPRLFTPRTVVSAHCDLPCGLLGRIEEISKIFWETEQN
jgi:hypothetical protein